MKKLAAMMLAAALAAGCLAGCGSQESSGGAGTGQTGDSGQTAETVGGEVADSQDEETVTLKWVIALDPQNDQDMVMEEVNKLLKEKINVQLELIPISLGEYDERTQLMISTNEDYDIIWTGSWKNNYKTAINQEAYLPLDELLQSEAGDKLREVIPEWLWSAGKLNGVQYCIPNLQSCCDQWGFYIQKEYADKYGLDPDSIKSARDLESFLQQIHDNEPDLIPMREDNMENWCGTTGTHEAMLLNSWVRVSYDDSTVFDMFERDKELYQMVNEWYHKGYLRSDLATVADNSTDVVTNKYVCRLAKYKPSGAAEDTAAYGVEYIGIPLADATMDGTQCTSTMSAISVNCEHPDKAMELLALVYSDPEIFNMLVYGLEGVHYDKVSENRIELKDNSGYYYGNRAWELGNQFEAWLLPENEDDVWEETAKMNEDSIKSPYMGFVVDTTDLSSEVAQLTAVVDEYKGNLYITDDFEGVWAEFKEACDVAGLQTFKAAAQEQLDAWIAANNE